VFIGKRRGGFGKLVRVIGQELVRHGFNVSVISWHEPNSGDLTELDGMEILSYPYDFTTHSSLKHIIDYTRFIPLVKKANADVYVSIDCMIETYLAQKVMPNKTHVIWVQDPRNERDHELISSIDPRYEFSRLKFWMTTKLYEKAYSRADLILTQARYYIPKIGRLFHVDLDKVVYLPNPIKYVPNDPWIAKSNEPVVCFLGRMDPIKRYWLFFELARKFPDIRFIAIGAPSLLYQKLYKRTVEKYHQFDNLRILGFVDGEPKFKLLSKCWVMILPSIYEGLPIAFLEALSHECALLSSVNPDNIVSKFGYWAKNDDFEEGLHKLLSNNLWKIRGEMGCKYVQEVHNLDRVIKDFTIAISHQV